MSTKNSTKPKPQEKKPEQKKMQIPKITARIDSIIGDEDSSLKAFASVNIGETFAVHGFRIVEGDNGLFVSMPSRKVGDEYKDVFHPITTEARAALNKQILDAYEQKQQEEQDEDLNEGEGQALASQVM